MEQYTVTGMSCAACQARVEKAVSKVPGVTSCSVSLLTNSMGVEGDADAGEVIKAVESAGYGASVKGAAKTQEGMYEAEEEALKDHETPKLKRRLILSLGFLAVLMYITMGHNMWGWPLPAYFTHNHLGLALTQMILALIVMYINRKFFTSGFSSLLHGAPNMDTLVALGSGVSFGWSLYVFYQMCGMITRGAPNMDLMELYHGSLYFESAAMIPALITVGKMLEAMSKGRTTDALKSLMKLAPKTAVILQDGEEKEVGIEQVQSGDIFIVRPGDSIPVDGVVLEGNSAVNESALTGESIPVDKAADDTVSAATINTSGYLKCRATRVGQDTTLSQIIRMVSDAAATKAPIARIADRVSGVFVPAVIAIAAVVTAGWLIAGAPLAQALERGICVLVISCPCALGLATPVAIMVGNGIGAKNGILFKTGEALEQAGKVQIIALDKTGTITEGKPEVTDIIPWSVRERELLEKAYALEVKSEHPLAKAVAEKAQADGIIPAAVTEFEALPGNGLKARTSEGMLFGGSEKYITGLVRMSADMKRRSQELSEQGKTPLFFAQGDTLLGMIAVADVVKDDSAKAIRELKNMGIETVMLTGDNARTAKAIAKIAGVDGVVSDVLPEGKEEVIRELQKRGKTAMVGDGINDAPALTRADVGIAIGAGTDVAIDSADIVLMNSRLSDAAASVRLSRSVLRNIHENLFWAFFYNIICIPLAAGLYGWKMNPMIGAAAMSVSSFTVCMNALRLNLVKIFDASKDRPLKHKALPKPEEKETDEVFYRVDGMMCEHCEARVKKALEKIDGIVEAQPDHTAGIVRTVQIHPVDEEIIRSAVEEQDYTYIGTGKEKTDTCVQIYRVDGMMCEHCEARVKKALEKIDGIAEAQPDHTAGIVRTVQSYPVDEEQIRSAVEEQDYTYIGKGEGR